MKTLANLLLRLLIYSVLFLLIIATVGVRLLDHYLQPEKIKPEIEQGLTGFLQRPVTIEKIYWQWVPRPLLFGENVRVLEKDGHLLLQSPQIRVFPQLNRLFDRQVFIRGIRFVDPVFILRIHRDRHTNFEELFTDIRNHLEATASPDLSLVTFYLRSLRLSEARLVVVDERLKPTPLSPRIIANGSFDIPSDTAPVRMTLNTTIQSGKILGSMKIFGALGDRSLVRFGSGNFPLEALSDYVPALANHHCPISLTATWSTTPQKTRWEAKGGTTEPVLFFPAKRPKLQFSFDLRSNSTSTVEASLYLDKTTGEITAALPQLDSPAVVAHGNFRKADIDEIYSSLRPFLTVRRLSVEGTRPPIQLASQISVDHLTYGNDFIDNLSAQISCDSQGQWQSEMNAPRVSYKGELFSFSTATLTYQDGALSGSDLIFSGLDGQGTVNFSFMNDSSASTASGKKQTGLGRSFDITWDVSNVDSQRLLSLFTEKTLTTGTLTSKGRLLGDRAHFISEDLRGSVDLTLKDGVISGLPGAVKFLSSMNIRTLIKKIRGKNTKGLAFRTFTAGIKIDQGQLKTPSPAKLHSDVIDLGFLGVVDLTKDIVDAEMDLQFLTVLDEVVRFFPGVKQILIGNRKSLVPIWLKINGPVEDPKVKVEKGKTIGKRLL